MFNVLLTSFLVIILLYFYKFDHFSFVLIKNKTLIY